MNFKWRKSKYTTDQGNCVEVAHHPADAVAVRDSKNPGNGHLVLSRSAWETFTAKIKAGHLG